MKRSLGWCGGSQLLALSVTLLTRSSVVTLSSDFSANKKTPHAVCHKEKIIRRGGRAGQSCYGCQPL